MCMAMKSAPVTELATMYPYYVIFRLNKLRADKIFSGNILEALKYVHKRDFGKPLSAVDFSGAVSLFLKVSDEKDLKIKLENGYYTILFIGECYPKFHEYKNVIQTKKWVSKPKDVDLSVMINLEVASLTFVKAWNRPFFTSDRSHPFNTELTIYERTSKWQTIYELKNWRNRISHSTDGVKLSDADFQNIIKLARKFHELHKLDETYYEELNIICASMSMYLTLCNNLHFIIGTYGSEDIEQMKHEFSEVKRRQVHCTILLASKIIHVLFHIDIPWIFPNIIYTIIIS